MLHKCLLLLFHFINDISCPWVIDKNLNVFGINMYLFITILSVKEYNIVVAEFDTTSITIYNPLIR